MSPRMLKIREEVIGVVQERPPPSLRPSLAARMHAAFALSLLTETPSRMSALFRCLGDPRVSLGSPLVHMSVHNLQFHCVFYGGDVTMIIRRLACARVLAYADYKTH